MVVDVLLDAVVGELADDPARDSPDGDRRQQRRREEANREPSPLPHPNPAPLGAAARDDDVVVFSHKLSVTALGMGRIIRFG